MKYFLISALPNMCPASRKNEQESRGSYTHHHDILDCLRHCLKEIEIQFISDSYVYLVPDV